MITTVSYPRAALIGNPSDGYFGKTIAFVFSNFKVEVQLRESKQLEIIPGHRDRLSFKTLDELVNEIKQNGYYGGIRLIKATIKKLCDYCSENDIPLPVKNFTLGFSSTIPDQLGLAGSSAIVTASIKAMLEFYGIEIPKPVLANLILSVEKDELHIGAGLQDRVAQAYGCPVFMNFDKNLMQKRGYGEYTPFDKNLLPAVYIAYRTSLAEGSEITHNDFARRYTMGDASVHRAVEQWMELTDETWSRLQRGNKNIADLLNRNFDIRKEVMNVSAGNLQMVETARSIGASAKFTGSGGAVIGTYEGAGMFEKLESVMKQIGVVVLKPEIV
jgi:glucuronokinase